jgi:HEAT repeat protein
MSLLSKPVDRASAEAWEMVKAAQGIIKDLERLEKSLHLHPPTNSGIQAILDALCREIRESLERCGSLELNVEGNRLLLDADPVYQSEGVRGISQILASGGARVLVFVPPVDRMEILGLGQALARISGGEEKDCDLATLLWFRSINGIRVISSGESLRGPAEAGRSTSQVLEVLAAREGADDGKSAIFRKVAPPVSIRLAVEEEERHILRPPDEADRRRLEARVRENRAYTGLLDNVRGLAAAIERGGPIAASDGKILERLAERVIEAADFQGALEIRDAIDGLAAVRDAGARESHLVLRAAAASLGSTRNIESVNSFLQLTSEEEAGPAFRFLARLEPPARERILGMLGKTRFDRQICAAITRICPGDISPFIGCLDSKNPKTAAAGAAALGESGNRASVFHLTRLVTHPDHNVRVEAVRAVGRFTGVEARRAVAAAFVDPDRMVRKAAYRSFQESTDEADREILREAAGRLETRGLEWLDREDRMEILRLLAARNGREGEDMIVDLLAARPFFGGNKRGGLRAAAARVLGERKCARAAEHLRKLLADRDPDVRSSAKDALSGMKEP